VCKFKKSTVQLPPLDCENNQLTSSKGTTPPAMTDDTDPVTTNNDMEAAATTDTSNQSARIVADKPCMYILSAIAIFTIVPHGWSEPFFTCTLAVLSGYYLQGIL
jgi:hypothetical protein